MELRQELSRIRTIYSLLGVYPLSILFFTQDFLDGRQSSLEAGPPASAYLKGKKKYRSNGRRLNGAKTLKLHSPRRYLIVSLLPTARRALKEGGGTRDSGPYYCFRGLARRQRTLSLNQPQRHQNPLQPCGSGKQRHPSRLRGLRLSSDNALEVDTPTPPYRSSQPGHYAGPMPPIPTRNNRN